MEQVSRAAHPAPVSEADKWQIIANLSVARKAFGISDRSLAVLNVLASVHGERMLREDDLLVVYASNATLSRRAHGMPESTLRRHLAALVEAGLIARHDSPNGKRYMRRGAGGEVIRAFGFDLAPLLHRACEIAQAAEDERAHRAERTALREEVTLLLRDAQKLSDYAAEGGASDALSDRIALTKRHLRRQLSLEEIQAIRDSLKPLVDKLRTELTPVTEAPAPATELSARDSQNERHIQVSDKTLSESEGSDRPNLREVLGACPDILPYADQPLTDWQGMVRTMSRLAPMTGIDPATWSEACRSLGPEGAAATLAGIVQRIGEIRSPGAYLRSLSQKARAGGFTPGPMIRSLAAAR